MITICTSYDEAVDGIADSSTVLVGGFGMAGMPVELIDALIGRARDLPSSTTTPATANRPGRAARGRAGTESGLLVPPAARLVGVRRPVPRGQIELEVVPQGNLAERMRAAGAGIGAFYCPTAWAPRWPRQGDR